MKKILSFINTHKELYLLTLLLIITSLSHGYNMLHYPAFFDDEGTYIAQSWSFLTKGELSHYTYWYDHPPLGWIQISFWAFLTGGLSKFGFALNSGRVFMLLLNIGSAFFAYRIARNLRIGIFASFVGTIIYILSPLAIAMDRMIFLDNIMIFWVLASLWLLTLKNKSIRNIIFSSIALGIAILSKETALIFIPIFAWYIYLKMDKHQRIFSVACFLFIVGSIGSIWILYAILKGELFPPGTFFTNPNTPHVSLIATIKEQLSRSGHGSLLTPGSDIRTSMYRWATGKFSLFEGVPDIILLILGTFSIFFNFIYGVFKKQKSFIMISLLGLLYILFLARGGVVLVFYIIGLLPLFGLNISGTLQVLTNSLKKIMSISFLSLSQSAIFIILIIAYMQFNYQSLIIVLFDNQTSANIQASEWLAKNVSPSKKILVDDYAYVDLIKTNNPIYYWKAQDDPAINQKVLNNDWRNIDYLLITRSFRSDLNGLPLVKKAYENSTKVATFDGDNYYKIEIYRVNKENNNEVLAKSWNYYKTKFINTSGKVTDPFSSKTTSEGQSYALLRAVWINDKTIFDNVLMWSTNNILLKDKSLFAWWYGKNDKGQIGIVDKGTATDADQDIAVALLLASKHWHEPKYQTLAQKIIADIWKYETVEIGGKRYVVAGNWSSERNKTVYTINPSYLSPYAYRMFAEVDKMHDWKGVVDSSYEILDKCSVSSLGKQNTTYLPPNWCNITKDGKVVAANEMGKDSTDYSFDALRMPWRIALDYQWNKDKRALAYLKKINLFTDEWKKNGKIYTAYTHEGKNTDKSESLAQYGTQLAYFTIIDKKIADKIYDAKINSVYSHNKNEFYWGDKNNYYNQNWVWFGTALYTNNLPNLWVNRK